MACISSIYMISWTLPVFYFLPKYFQILFQHFLSFLEESTNINGGIIRMTHGPKRVSQTLIPLENVIRMTHSSRRVSQTLIPLDNVIRMTHGSRCVSQTLIPLDIHTLIWITIIKCLAFFQNSILQQSFSVVNILPTSFNHPIMTTFMIKLLQLIRTNYEYNINSQNIFGRSGRLASPTFTNYHTI